MQYSLAMCKKKKKNPLPTFSQWVKKKRVIGNMSLDQLLKEHQPQPVSEKVSK